MQHTLAGRILLNNAPTGVEVCASMVHGGPYPATTDARFTSVGTTAIKRWVRPICLQNFNDNMLPDALKNENPLGILRLVDNVYTRETVKNILVRRSCTISTTKQQLFAIENHGFIYSARLIKVFCVPTERFTALLDVVAYVWCL